jgi:hypothetical protein
MLTDDRQLYDVLVVGVTLMALGWLIVGLVRVARRTRPGLELARPLAAAAATRIGVAALVAAVPALRPLRGPDEINFLIEAHRLAEDSSFLGPMPRGLLANLHVGYMGMQERLLEPTSDFPFRIGHIALAIVAIAIVAIAVTDLAGPRAGRISAWILAFEPTNVFFSGVLHKEAPMLLGEALVILGAVRMYQRRDALALLFMAPGIAIAWFARPYAGAALLVACAAVCVHAALRRLGPERRRAPRMLVGVGLAAIVAAAAAPAPAAVFRTVQLSQNANATDASNLALDPVDFSSLTSTGTHLGPRVKALLLQPYPWQVANANQRAGVIGTAAAWLLLTLTVMLAVTRLRLVVTTLMPLLYVIGALTLIYTLSAGNAGTGFRYRTHILVVLVAIFAVLLLAHAKPMRYLSRR